MHRDRAGLHTVRGEPAMATAVTGLTASDIDVAAGLAASTGTARRRHLRAFGRMLWALLLGGAAVLGAMFAFRQGLLPWIEAMFQPDAGALSGIRRAGIFLAAMLGYWAYVRGYEKRAATELRLRPVALLLGGIAGAALVALPIAALFGLGAYELVQARPASSALLGVAAVIGIAATLEELLYRCLLLQVLERAWGTRVALAVQALVFALPHLANVQHGTSADAVAMLVSVTLLGLLWGGVFVLTRNLWAAAAHHAAWNFSILLSGVPLSGIEDWRALAPMETRYAGPDWLTGGMFGPENSLLVIAAIAMAVVLVLRAAHRRGKLLPPAGLRAG